MMNGDYWTCTECGQKTHANYLRCGTCNSDRREQENAKPDLSAKPISTHVGKKYLRRITSPITGESIEVDVYAVLEAFAVTCPARQHAVKKILCAGLRGKGSQLQDLDEAFNASGQRAIEMQKVREGQP